MPDKAISTAREAVKDTLNIDPTKCDTDAKKAASTAGGWNCNFGKREWDYKKAAQVVALFFPATSAAAAKSLLDDLESQFKGAVKMLEDLAESAGNDVRRQQTTRTHVCSKNAIGCQERTFVWQAGCWQG